MAIAEIFKDGKLVQSRSVPDDKAARGITIRLGENAEVRLMLGETKRVGAYTASIRAENPVAATAAAQTKPRPDQPTAPTARSLVDHDAETAPLGAIPPTPASASQPSIDGYKVLGRLGAGGMGVVWCAEQTATQRQVALKVMSGGLLGSDKARARFEREVKLAAALEHPNIARIYDSGIHKGDYYYAMQLVDGEHLDAYTRHRMLDHRAAAGVVLKICKAVGCAHSAGVIHRDLKPSNILVNSEGEPVIVDFGLARGTEEKPGAMVVSVEGEAAGTPAYMSPEQAAGRNTDVDRRTDVYALGVILYRLVTGRYPHDMSGPMHDVMKRIVEDEIRPPSMFSTIDPDLEAVLMCACAHEPTDRYASANEMAEDLERFLAESPVVARRYTTTQRVRRTASRHRPRIIAGALAAVGVASVAFAIYWGIQHARQASEEAARQIAMVRAERSKLQEQLDAAQKEAAGLKKLLDGAGKGGASTATALELSQARSRLSQLQIEMETMQYKLHDLEGRLGESPAKTAAAEPPATPPVTSVQASVGTSAPPAPRPNLALPPRAPGPNAADVYRGVYAALGPNLLTEVGNENWTAAYPMLLAHSADINRLIDATKYPNCDFGADWSQGIATLLPYLGQMRGLTRVLRAEGERRMQNGDQNGACLCAAAALRLSVHVTSRAESTIELLVGIAIAQVGNDFVAAHRDLRKASAKTEILLALEEVAKDDILHSGVIIQRELAHWSTWLRHGPLPNLAADNQGRDWTKVSPEERERAAAAVDDFAAKVLVLWSSPDTTTTNKLKALEVDAGRQGFADILPALGGVHTRLDLCRGALNQSSAILR